MGELLDLVITGEGFPIDRPELRPVTVPDVEIKKPETKKRLERDRLLDDLNNRVRERLERE